ncbi:MAG: hypothetical protein KAR20_01610, partial [Candidatus Heimdallarchaeota archaeon]|nr:hypothetical protein [Candidatus Heimdallarchaeota archaeon]
CGNREHMYCGNREHMYCGNREHNIPDLITTAMVMKIGRIFDMNRPTPPSVKSRNAQGLGWQGVLPPPATKLSVTLKIPNIGFKSKLVRVKTYFRYRFCCA